MHFQLFILMMVVYVSNAEFQEKKDIFQEATNENIKTFLRRKLFQLGSNTRPFQRILNTQERIKDLLINKRYTERFRKSSSRKRGMNSASYDSIYKDLQNFIFDVSSSTRKEEEQIFDILKYLIDYGN